MPPVVDLETLTRHEGHTVFAVYREMLLQVCRDYSTLPDPRTLSMREIRNFYEPLRGDLKEHTKRKKS